MSPKKFYVMFIIIFLCRIGMAAAYDPQKHNAGSGTNLEPEENSPPIRSERKVTTPSSEYFPPQIDKYILGISLDSKRGLVTNLEGNYQIVDLATGAVRDDGKFEHGYNPRLQHAQSADGRWLVFGNVEGASLLDRATLKVKSLKFPKCERTKSIAISNGGKSMAYRCRRPESRQIIIRNLDSGEEKIGLEIPQYEEDRGFSFSSDGKTLAVSLFSPVPSSINGPAPTPNGKVILFGLTSSIKREYTLPGARDVSFSPDGERLLFQDREKATVLDIKTGGLKTIFEGEHGSLYYSPNGKYILGVGSPIEIYRTADGMRFNYAVEGEKISNALVSGEPARIYVSRYQKGKPGEIIVSSLLP